MMGWREGHCELHRGRYLVLFPLNEIPNTMKHFRTRNSLSDKSIEVTSYSQWKQDITAVVSPTRQALTSVVRPSMLHRNRGASKSRRLNPCTDLRVLQFKLDRSKA